MSTVLWANLLVNGEVKSEQADRSALYTHGEKLDAITKQLGLPSFLAACDTTDARFNTEDLDLPSGVTSTDEVMARQGDWIEVADAVAMLESLLHHIRTNNVRFGLLRNQHQEVVTELTEVIAFVKAGGTAAQKFNFSVVM